MVLINKALNEVTLKLVYYGPGLCGKTTNLEKIYQNPKLEQKGKMISMSTETDRTLFFDFMPMELGTIGGQKIRVQLYTVPGQVFYDATRKLVLRGADGVVFVADSQADMRESNLESLENLHTNLRINRINPDKIAVVYQYNKRDLPNAASVEDISAYMEPGNIPVVEAIAVQGVGVTATLRAAVARILDNMKNNVDITLHEQPELTAPDMSARAAMASPGGPKVAVTPSPAAAPPKAHPSTAPTVQMPRPEPAPASPSKLESVFAADTRPSFEVPMDSVFDSDPAQLGAGPEPEGQPFHLGAAEEPAGLDRMELESMLQSARDVIRSLEVALDAAREHERQIAAKLE